MNAHAVECQTAAAHCEDKLAKVRILLRNKHLNKKKQIIKLSKKAFVEAGSVQEVFEDTVNYEDFEYIPNYYNVKYFSPGLISSHDYRQVDASKVNTNVTISNDIKNYIATYLLKKYKCPIILNENNKTNKSIDAVKHQKECTELKEMDVTDENTSLKEQLISSCEDKVIRLKALLSGRKHNKRSVLNRNNKSSEDLSSAPLVDSCGITLLSCGEEYTSDITQIIENDKDNVQFEDKSILLDITQHALDCDSDLPDSCYVSNLSNDLFEELRTESLIKTFDLDSDSDSGQGMLNLISCTNFTRTVNDLTDESLYDETNLTEISRVSSDSDDEIDCILGTICEVQEEDEHLNSDVEDVKPKLVSVLVNYARKLEKKEHSSKEVTFSEAPPKVHVMRVWAFAARQARVGHWEQQVIDRDRFRRRIADVDMAISWVLKPQHRARVKFQRFMPWWHALRREEQTRKREQLDNEKEILSKQSLLNEAIDEETRVLLSDLIEKVTENLEISDMTTLTNKSEPNASVNNNHAIDIKTLPQTTAETSAFINNIKDPIAFHNVTHKFIPVNTKNQNRLPKSKNKPKGFINNNTKSLF